MEEILEIRDGCETPLQLLKSKAFAQYLEIYKKQFTKELELRKDTDQKEEALHKIKYIKSIRPKTFIDILEGATPFSGDELMQHRQSVRFFDGAFHHYRTKSYTRLVRLHNEILEKNETTESIKDKITTKAHKLSDLILELRRILLIRVGFNEGVRRTQGLECHPNVTCGEISGHYIDLPSTYSNLSHVPITTTADMRTGVHYTTHANKRAFPFFALDHNPYKNKKFNPEEYVAIPFEVGKWNIIAYIHKSRGCIEMEPGLLNLFPFSNVKNLANKKPDGIFIFGCPHSTMDDLGYFYDKKDNILVGLIPNIDDCKYFGYGKKPVLTLHNVLCILNDELPLHCGCTRYAVRFDTKTNEPYIFDSFIKADDMGRASLQNGNKKTMTQYAGSVPYFFGTETGAFACLDGFSEHAKMQMEGREIGYNKHSGTNARQIVPVTDYAEVSTGSELDILLYLNNYDLIAPGNDCMNVNMDVDEALDHFRKGARVAAGSTQTHRGKVEISYWANPFPLLKDKDWKDLPEHKDLCQKFEKIEKKFFDSIKKRVEAGHMKIGVAHSMLMAGVYEKNTDAKLTKCGFNDRDLVEHQGPERAAKDMISLIKKTAVDKRKQMPEGVNEVNITVASVGDSRTGKSEMAEKMEGVLNMSLI
ncbi:MAG: hypothetical protein CMD49_00255 [Gammaproteobacteria bacterium]|nr:hypothetical protein [Gammaproteobacteria bacterium]